MSEREPQWKMPRGSELRGARMVWLLRIRWAGIDYHLASEHVDLTTLDGDPIRFDGAFDEPELDEEIDFFQSSVSSLSVPLTVYFDEVDVPARVFRDRAALSAAEADLSVVLVDEETGGPLQSWDERWPLLKGHIERPQIDHPRREAGWARFSVESRPFDDSTTIIPTNARINDQTFLSPPDESIGAVYPQVFGKGLGWDGSTTYFGSPAYPVLRVAGQVRLLISLGRVTAASVTVHDASGNTAVRPVIHTEDRVGQVYAYALATTASGLTVTDEEWWISWYDGSAPVGGIRRLDSTEPITGWGDLLAWLWSLPPDGVDLVSWVSVARCLNRYTVAGYIQDPDVTVWEWAKSKALPLLPVAVVPRPDGLTPVLLELADSNIAAEVTEGPHFRRVSSWTAMRSRRDFYNVLSIEYQHDPESGRYRQQARYGSEFGADEEPILHALDSAQLWGRRIEQIVTTEFITDPETVAILGDELLRAGAHQVFEADFEADPEWGWLRAGAVLRYTEGGKLTRQRGYITGRGVVMGAWRFRVRIILDPVVDLRAAG